MSEKQNISDVQETESVEIKDATETTETDTGEGQSAAQNPEVPYQSKVEKLISHENITTETFSDKGQELIKQLRILTDDFSDWDDPNAKRLDALAYKWLRDEYSGKQVSQTIQEQTEALNKKIQEVEEKEEKIKAEKDRKKKEAEEKAAKDQEAQKPKHNIDLESYINKLYKKGINEIPTSKLKEFGFNPPEGEFQFAGFHFEEYLYFEGYWFRKMSKDEESENNKKADAKEETNE